LYHVLKFVYCPFNF